MSDAQTVEPEPDPDDRAFEPGPIAGLKYAMPLLFQHGAQTIAEFHIIVDY